MGPRTIVYSQQPETVVMGWSGHRRTPEKAARAAVGASELARRLGVSPALDYQSAGEATGARHGEAAGALLASQGEGP